VAGVAAAVVAAMAAVGRSAAARISIESLGGICSNKESYLRVLKKRPGEVVDGPRGEVKRPCSRSPGLP
jgi:hypothetical protein